MHLEDQRKQAEYSHRYDADHREQTTAAASSSAAARGWRCEASSMAAKAAAHRSVTHRRPSATHRGTPTAHRGPSTSHGASAAMTAAGTAWASATGTAVMSSRTWHSSFLPFFFLLL